MESKGKVFRQLLRDEPYLFTGGIYSPLDAQIAERAGMKSIYLSGYSVAMMNGFPDMGLLTMTEVAKTASMVASAVEVPIIADADDGYGNALSTMRTVQEFVKTGVAGIHLEDQRFPKRCGHIAGKTVVSREEAIGKYKAALAERDRLDREFVIIARTDAYGAVGGSMEEAVWRGRAYADKQLIEEFSEELPRALRVNPIVEVPADVLLVGRMMGLLSGLGKSLDSQVNLFTTIMPYAQRLMMALPPTGSSDAAANTPAGK